MSVGNESLWMGVIDKYYSDNQPLRDLLLLHSRLVADKALKIVAAHPELGADLLRSEGLPRHALVAERHTGTGLTLKQILERDLPVPHRDMIPVSIEEKIVCFADKFYSKTNPEDEKTIEQAERSLAKFGEEGVMIFREWCRLFL